MKQKLSLFFTTLVFIAVCMVAVPERAHAAWEYFNFSIEYTVVPPTPVDGSWGPWGPWSDCSVTACGQTGTQTRTRTCTPPQNGGAPCAGSSVETQACSTAACPPGPVDGYWGPWGPWSDCSVTACGQTGTQTRTRTCTPPQNGGAPCAGSSVETQACSTAACPSIIDVCPNLSGTQTTIPSGYSFSGGNCVQITVVHVVPPYNPAIPVDPGTPPTTPSGSTKRIVITHVGGPGTCSVIWGASTKTVTLVYRGGDTWEVATDITVPGTVTGGQVSCNGSSYSSFTFNKKKPIFSEF